jgi:RND family efflux transporter MFP subunit
MVSGWTRAAGLALAALALGACEQEAEPLPPEIRPVRVITVERAAQGERVVLSGVVEAQTEVALGFRIGGRVLERLVDVGDRVEPGQLLARLDPENEENALRSARAAVSASAGRLEEAQANYERQRQLLDRGFTTRQRYDEARQVLRTAQAAADDANAQLEIARVRLTDTELRADAEGAVIERAAEAGEVVQPGQPVFRVARDDGRDAVFDVPAALIAIAPPDPEVAVALTIDPAVSARGRVREVAPRADAATGAFRVRVGLSDVPEAMRLGSTVTGSIETGGGGGVRVPASALTYGAGGAAVWVVDPAASTVALRPVEVLRHGAADVEIGDGLNLGDVVVTAGVQALRPGQQVRLLGQPGAGS